MSPRDLIELSIKHGQLSRCFTEAMSERPQQTFVVSPNQIDQVKEKVLAYNLPTDDDLFCTRDEYNKVFCDFEVINKNGDTILTSSKDGNIINGIAQEDYMRDEEKLSKLLEIYKLIEKATICTVVARE